MGSYRGPNATRMSGRAVASPTTVTARPTAAVRPIAVAVALGRPSLTCGNRTIGTVAVANTAAPPSVDSTANWAAATPSRRALATNRSCVCNTPSTRNVNPAAVGAPTRRDGRRAGRERAGVKGTVVAASEA